MRINLMKMLRTAAWGVMYFLAVILANGITHAQSSLQRPQVYAQDIQPVYCAQGRDFWLETANGKPDNARLHVCIATDTWMRISYGVGTTLPATCGVGQMFFKTDASAGANIYGCTSANTWTAQAGGGGGSSGITASTSNPAGACVPGTDNFHFNTSTDHGFACYDSTWTELPQYARGTGTPNAGVCTNNYVGMLYVRTDAQAANGSLYVCSQTGVGTYTWELAQSAGGSTAVTAASTYGTDNAVIRADGTGRGTQSSQCSIDDSGVQTCAGGFVSTAAGTTSIDFTKGTAPSAPGAGKISAFYNSSGKLQDKDESSNVRTYLDSLNPDLGVGPSAVMVEVANAASTGTTVKKLAKLTGAPSTAVLLSTSDTNSIFGIVQAGAGTTGNAVIARAGTATCTFDGATTAGQYVVASGTVAGACKAQAYPTTAGQQAIGIVLQTIGSAGDALVALFGSEARVASAGGSTPTILECAIFTNVAHLDQPLVRPWIPDFNPRV